MSIMDSLDWHEPANDNFCKCAVCGGVLPAHTGKGRKRKYCSGECLKAAFKVDPNGYVGDCDFCSAPMFGRKRKYCNSTCRQEARKPPKKARVPKPRKARVVVAGKCLECGIDFIGPPTKKFCGDKCARKYNEARRDRYANAPERTCEHCGKTFKRKPNKKDAARFCSRQCGYNAKSNVSTKRVASSALRAEAKRLKVSYKVIWCLCVQCGTRFAGKNIAAQYCSTDCRHMAHWAKKGVDPSPRKCPECNKVFRVTYGRGAAVYCSVKCSKKHNGRKGKSKRKALLRRADNDNLNPFDIFKRDGWKCQLCGIKTPRKLRGTYEPNAPELDHILPLSLGGSHTADNVQCACRKCNGAKGATPMGQMLLFG